MTNTIQPVDSFKHKDVKIKHTNSYDHVKDAQFMPLNANELSYASTCYPIFFIKDKATAKLFPIALFGFESKENLFFETQQWQASYVPKAMQFSSFSLAKFEEPNGKQKNIVCIDSSSPYICDQKSQVQGQALFENNQESRYFSKLQKDLGDFYIAKVATLSFVERLLELNLIKSVQLRLNYDAVDHSVSKSVVQGLYTINEHSLNNLPADVVQEFYQNGSFSCIYSLLNSQQNLYNLIDRQQSRGLNSVKSFHLISQ